MSKKRTATEPSNDEQANESSSSLFQEDDNAKRAKLAPFSETTLQDLPMELIECILVKAVAMEVKGMKLAKSVWKEKADLVISRLRTVCSQWSSILTTNFFRNELQRTLDAMGTVHMEILHQSPIIMPPKTCFFPQLITMKDQVFMLCRPEDQTCYAYIVYDRNNMTQVKGFIPLPEMLPFSVAACNVANCLYIFDWWNGGGISVIRNTEEEQHEFAVSSFPCDILMPNSNPTLAVTADGNLILSGHEDTEIPVISIYNANGSLQHDLRLSSERLRLRFSKIIPKSNGNLVLVSENKHGLTKLMEVDMTGNILRQYQSSLDALKCVCDAHKYGRILIAERLNRMELLDSEFNLMDFTTPQLDEDRVIYRGGMHYDSDRNEIVTVVRDTQHQESALTIFRFTEE